MKSAFWTVPFVAMLVGLVLADLSVAQPGGGNRGGRGGFGGGFGGPGGGAIGLLQRDDVRQEIQLVGEQRDKLEAIADDLQAQMRDEMRDLFGQMRDLSDAEREAQLNVIRARMEAVQSDVEAEVKKILLPHQFERLKQIELQTQMQTGGGALNSRQLADALGLTDEQAERLRQRAEEVEREVQDQVRQIRLDARNKILDVLTAAQRAKLESLIGEPFDAQPQQFGRGGRGGRGGGRAGQGR